MKSAPLKHLVDPHRPITYGIVQAGPDTPNGVPYIRPTDMTQAAGVLDPGTLQRTTPEIAATYKRSEVLGGDVVLSIGPSYGKVMVVPTVLRGANLTQGTARLAPAQHVFGRFLYWALQSKIARDYWDMAVAGATFRALNLEPLSQTPIPIAPIEQQRRIADFLDDQIPRLDRVIELRARQPHEQLERRHSLLAERLGVSDSLLSVVEGYGRSTRGWPTRKLSQVLTATVAGGTPPTGDPTCWADPPDGVPWISIGDMREGGVTADPAKHVTSHGLEAARIRIAPAGTVLFAMYASVGKTSIASTTCVWNQAILGLVPGSHLRPRYLLHWLELCRRVLTAFTRSSTQDNLNADQVRSLHLPLPTIEEQDAFLEAISSSDAIAADLDFLNERQSTLLGERRQALITAAVMGQFDVTTARAVA